MPKIIANEIRPGNILEHKGKLWQVAKIMHTQPGKGGAYIQVEMKDIKSGTKLNERFRSQEAVERARLEQHDFQYLFTEGNNVTLMDLNSYEQQSLPKDLAGDAAVFLQEGMMVTAEVYEHEVLSITLPETVVLEITSTEAVVKGQTAASSYKPAELENGVRVLVPPFVSSGDRIVVRTADSTYVERAKG